MNNLSFEDETLLTDTLAACLGFKRVLNQYDRQVWAGPASDPALWLSPPRFAVGWGALPMLIKEMRFVGFDNFKLQQLAPKRWLASFDAKSQLKLAYASLGINPGQAAAFAALLAFAGRGQADQSQDHNIDWRTITDVITKYVNIVENQQVVTNH